MVSLEAGVPASWFLFLLHAASARAAMMHARSGPTFIHLAPCDRGYRVVVLGGERRRAAASGNLRGKRLQAVPQLGIGDLAQSLAKLLGHGTKLRPLGARRRGRRPAPPGHEAVARPVPKEEVDPAERHRGPMLDQRRMGP